MSLLVARGREKKTLPFSLSLINFLLSWDKFFQINFPRNLFARSSLSSRHRHDDLANRQRKMRTVIKVREFWIKNATFLEGYARTLGFSRQHISLVAAGERSTRVFLVHSTFFRLSLLSPLSSFLSFTRALFVRGFIPAYPKGGMNYSDGGENV